MEERLIVVLTGQRNAALDAVAQLQVVVMDLRQRVAELEAAATTEQMEDAA